MSGWGGGAPILARRFVLRDANWWWWRKKWEKERGQRCFCLIDYAQRDNHNALKL